MRRISSFTSIALGLVAGPALMAQTSAGALDGAVLTKAGVPITGAKVIVSSKALFAPKTFITDAKGEWKAFLLPPGDYDVTATKDGYVAASARNVRVGIGGTIRQDLSLTPMKEAAATVEVVGSVGTVDKTDTKSAANFSEDTLATLATALGDRGFNGALSVAPGVITETPSAMPTIRGGTISATNFTVNGADVKDQLQGQVTGDWYVDDNIEDVQVVLSPLNARYGRAAGGSVNVVTKTGSNDFSGSIRSTFTRQSWDATSAQFPNPLSDSLQRTWNVVVSGPIIKDRLWFNVATILSPESSTNATLVPPGGNGWRFPVGVFPTGNHNADSMLATNLITGAPLPGSTIPAGYGFGFPYMGSAGASGIPVLTGTGYPVPQVVKNTYWEGKITGAIVPDHILEYAIMRSDRTKTNTDPNDDMWHDVRPQSLGTLETKRSIDGLTYRGTLSPTLFIEARYTMNETKLVKPLGDPMYGGGQDALYQHGLVMNVVPGSATMTDAQAAANYWANEGYAAPNKPYTASGVMAYGYQPFGPWVSATPTKEKSTSYNLDVKWIREAGSGSHEIDFGIDGYSTKYDNNANFNTSDLGSLNRQYVIGGYLQSMTDPTKLLFPVVNYDGNAFRDPELAFLKWSYGTAPTMIQYTGPQGGSINTDMTALFANDQWTINQHWNAMLGLRVEKQKVTDSTGSELASSTTFSPRLQIRYDIKGDSRSLITFTAAQFQGDLPQSFIAAFATTPQSSGTYYGYSGVKDGSGNPIAVGAATDTPVAGQGGYGVRFVDWATLQNASNYQTVITSFDSSKTNVVDSGLKPPSMTELTLGYSRTFNDGSNVSITYVNRTWGNLWAIGYDYVPSEVATITPNSSYAIKEHFFNSSALKREYDGVETSFEIKTKSIWSFNGSWNWSRLTGNDEQGDDPTGYSSILQTNPTPLFFNQTYLHANNVPSDTYAPYGRLLNDLTNRIRLGVTATLPFSKGGVVTLSWMAHYVEGSPFGSVAFGNNSGIGLPIPAITQGGVNVPGNTTILGYVGGRRPFEQNGLGSVDFRATFKYPLPLWKLQIFGDLIVTNFFNHMETGYATAFNSAFGSDLTRPGSVVLQPGFGGPTGDSRLYTEPRTVSASLGLRF